jgi:glycosyltransferase involved in cell wall biosynthesis
MKKVLFLSIVPPFPNDQGNRMVTLNVMDYFVNKGYFIEAVFQCGIDNKLVEKHFNNKVKVHEARNTHLAETFDFKTRDKIKELLKTGQFTGYNESIKKEIFYAANHFHPFAFINDQMVEIARKLLSHNQFDLVICNYLYSLRPVKELKDLMGRTKSLVITIDAASKLDEQTYYYDIDMSFKACSKEMEKECLDFADYVAAISKTEQEYFKQIGVTSEIILSEFNAYDHLENIFVTEKNFQGKQLFFGASNNLLNQKSIEDFLTRCWPSIVTRVPEAELVVAGKICSCLPGNYKNVVVKGLVSYETYLDLMASATIAINPVYIGTGLKIKTVEAISMGLPSVSFAAGIDGLEELKDQAFFLAEDWPGFADLCVKLLSDYQQWNQMRLNAREIGKNRFTGAAVFKEFDRILKKIE